MSPPVERDHKWECDPPELTQELCRLDNEVMATYFATPGGSNVGAARAETLFREIAKVCVRVSALERGILGK